MTNTSKNTYYIKRNLPFYVDELRCFAGANIDTKSLSSIEEVENIRKKSLPLNELQATKNVVKFSEKNSDRFKRFIENLREANSNPVYIWLHSSNLHGLLKVDSIDAIDFSFPFNVNSDGIVVFLTSDFSDRLLLDFYHDCEGQEMLEVELKGKHWSSIPLY